MKQRGWKWGLGILACAALAFGSIVWNAHRRASAVFARHDRQVQEAIEAIRARPAGRPCLFEPMIPGDGWPAYQRALAGFEAMPQADSDELPSLKGDPQFRHDPARVEEILEKYAPLVDALRRSSRASTFVPPYRYEDGWQMDMGNVTSALSAARFLSDRALHGHENIQDGAALESILLGLGLGHDTGRSGSMISFLIQIVCEGIEEEALREILAGHSFQAADLQSFAGKLDRLWEARPSIVDAFQVEDALIRRSVVDVGTRGMGSRADIGLLRDRSWRYLFSRRLAYAASLGELEEAMRACRALASLAPNLRSAAADKLMQKPLCSTNPVVKEFLPALSRGYARDAHAMMNWTLMRVSVAIAWYESERGLLPEKLEDLVPRYLPKLPSCPLSGLPLGYRDGRVWSAGRNGIDDGGVPGKSNDPDDEDGDVVWTVRRE